MMGPNQRDMHERVPVKKETAAIRAAIAVLVLASIVLIPNGATSQLYTHLMTGKVTYMCFHMEYSCHLSTVSIAIQVL